MADTDAPDEATETDLEAAEPDLAADSGPTLDAQPIPEAEPAPAADPAPAVDPEPEPVPAADLAPAVDSEPEPEPLLESDEEPVSETGPVSQAEAEPTPAVEPMPEPDSAVDSTLAAEPALTTAPAPAPVIERVSRSVGRIIADALHAAGATVAFTVPGESFLGLLDAMPEAGIRVVAARHEGGAAFMAEAYGQLTGRPGIVLGTRAVGAANLAIGVHTARADSSPMFAIIGGVQRALRGREAFQEADLVGSIGRLAKWATEIDAPSRVEPLMGEAVRHALAGRPGPVLIVIPEDLLDESMEVVAVEAAPFRPTRVEPEPDDVHALLHLLTSARRPVILAGAGVLRSRGTADLVRLAELLEVPVIASWRRADVFPNDHRLYLGMTGYGAPDTVPARLESADAIVVLGCRLNEIASHEYAIPPRGVRWAQVDLEPRVAHAGLPAPDLTVVADARTFLRIARRRVSAGVLLAEPFDARRAANDADRTAYEAASVVDGTAWDGPGVHPGRVVATLNEVLPPQTIVSTDAGNFAGWAARGYRFRRPGTFLGPTSGAMGYALPAAVAAAIEHPGRPVVALAGDGGFAMTMSELETAVRERARVVAIVFDNARYGTIRVHQDRRGSGVGLATDLGPVDFAAVATAMGAAGRLVESDADFEHALRAALEAEGPTVIHLRIDRRWSAVGRLEPA